MSSATLHQTTIADRLRPLARSAAIWLFVITLAWSPFPLGGAMAWAAGVQELLIALCWLLWFFATVGDANERWTSNRIILIPLVLAAAALMWALVQITPGVPQNWLHPVWAMAAEAIGKPVQGMISINPWRTEAEIVKLSSYVMACWLVFRMARNAETAKLLLNAVIAIGATYALYAFVLEFSGSQQTQLFYSVPYRNPLLSGPFMLHNSFATYSGLVTIAAVTKLFAAGSEAVRIGRGWRRLVESTMQYCFGRGAFLLVASLLAFAGVVASASRAGFASTMIGLIVIALTSLFVVRGQTSRLWASAGALLAAAPLLLLVLMNGDTLESRTGQLLSSGTADAVRLSLWSATQRMISDAPLLGLGLGSFEDAYPLYASQVFAFVMDKAHCDYLEFAAGLGLPAAIAWWTALIWLAGLCFRGVRVRRRNRLYSIAALGACALVAVHSSVDFSLQLPAVALLYATLIGIGVGQSISTKDRAAR